MSLSDTRILLTGVNGQVGGDLLPLLQPFATVIAADLPDFDFLNSEAIRGFVIDCKPNWIVNPAAYTAVDK
jgi:dTDP-4-dehydrorhamnose reductase